MLTDASLFGGPQRSWWKCWAIAFAVEGAIVLFIASQVFRFAPIIGPGADNPTMYYLGYAVQLPGSLLFIPFFRVAQSIGLSDQASWVFAATPIVMMELVTIAVLLRRPWLNRRDRKHVV